MKKLKLTSLLLLTLLIFMLAACGGESTASTDVVLATQPTAALEGEAVQPVNTQEIVATEPVFEPTAVPISVTYDNDDLTVSESSAESSADTDTIDLADDTTTFTGDGVVVDGSIVTITMAGTYSISGTLTDGQLVVDTQDEETVTLILNGVNITNTTSAPIYVSNADKTVITLADGTENVVTDGTSYVFPDAETDEPNAAVFSKDDLTINGTGSLIVNANFNNGIASKDDLKITGGLITVNAVNDGIKGRDSIAVLAGDITVNAGGDGLQANNDEDAEKGWISIEGGSVVVTAVLDGIQAETILTISDGNIIVVSGGGSGSTAADSAKGLKAGVDITIDGGTIVVDAADDAIHSNSSITINGGDIIAASADDAVHSDDTLVINGGDLTISQSYEGLESDIIIINEGNIHLVSSDDGINVTSGDTGGGESVAQGKYFEINGGTIVLDAGGDGLDSNGSGTLNGGVVLVNGPTEDRNGALDVNGTLTINGGFLVAVGSAGMAQSPGTDSTQYSVLVTLPSMQPAGSMIHIQSEAGEEVLTYVSSKAFETAVFSSPALENGTTYLVYTGGSSTGTEMDGLYVDGTYTPGTQVSSFTITSMVTGESTGMGGQRGGGGGRP
ncbi:MAG: carbohydrate-binding domain-containing protein [Anaerolineae bacterium]|nr:carbohydrate-binding domain-containing protein [Anaerolineae bacterium]